MCCNKTTVLKKKRIWNLWKKELKRRRKRKNRNIKKSIPAYCIKNTLQRYYTSLLFFLKEKGFVDRKYIENNILIPKIFSFKDSPDEVILFLKQLISTYLLSPYRIIIDFSKCEKICMSGFTLFDIVMSELLNVKSIVNQSCYKKLLRKEHIIPSRVNIVNKYLYIYRYIKEYTNPNKDDEYLPLNLISGCKKNRYSENTKSKACTKIREFVNETLHKYNVELNIEGVNAIDNMISEILGNAEDHSVKMRWYVNGISYKDSGDDLIEFNLSILNFGYSIYEGFEENKKLNHEIYNLMDAFYVKHQKQFSSTIFFTKESLFTLYALQEGISRLKYQQSSRGNGTMNFIEAFINLGELGSRDIEHIPELNIISGNTLLSCNNEYKPYVKDGMRLLSLNSKNDLSLLPDKNRLRHNKECFPGTFFNVKIYLDRDKLLTAIENKDGAN